MTWVQIQPEKPRSAFESAMYPIDGGRTYRGRKIPNHPGRLLELTPDGAALSEPISRHRVWVPREDSLDA